MGKGLQRWQDTQFSPSLGERTRCNGFPWARSKKKNLSLLKDGEAWEQTTWGAGGISAAGGYQGVRETSLSNMRQI